MKNVVHKLIYPRAYLEFKQERHVRIVSGYLSKHGYSASGRIIVVSAIK